MLYAALFREPKALQKTSISLNDLQVSLADNITSLTKERFQVCAQMEEIQRPPGKISTKGVNITRRLHKLQKSLDHLTHQVILKTNQFDFIATQRITLKHLQIDASLYQAMKKRQRQRRAVFSHRINVVSNDFIIPLSSPVLLIQSRISPNTLTVSDIEYSNSEEAQNSKINPKQAKVNTMTTRIPKLSSGKIVSHIYRNPAAPTRNAEVSHLSDKYNNKPAIFSRSISHNKPFILPKPITAPTFVQPIFKSMNIPKPIRYQPPTLAFLASMNPVNITKMQSRISRKREANYNHTPNPVVPIKKFFFKDLEFQKFRLNKIEKLQNLWEVQFQHRDSQDFNTFVKSLLETLEPQWKREFQGIQDGKIVK